METVDFPIFDADNHYYEATDAFTRYIDPSMRKRTMQWAEVDGKTRLLVGGSVNRFIPNPTFEAVSSPGCSPTSSGRSRAWATCGPGSASSSRSSHDRSTATGTPASRHGRSGHRVDDHAAHPRRGHGGGARARPGGVDRGVHRLQPVVAGGLGVQPSGPHLRGPVHQPGRRRRAVAELEHALDNDARVVLLRPGPVGVPGGRRTPAILATTASGPG